jgi:hypothetical protein
MKGRREGGREGKVREGGRKRRRGGKRMAASCEI